MHRDDKDEEMSGMSGPIKDKDVSPSGGIATPTSNYVFINENYSNFDKERHTYKTALITSNYN